MPKQLNTYGRYYTEYLFEEIDPDRCYPAVLSYLKAVRHELKGNGYFTDRDILKLQQIAYRTSGDLPPANPDYPLFFEDEE